MPFLAVPHAGTKERQVRRTIFCWQSDVCSNRTMHSSATCCGNAGTYGSVIVDRGELVNAVPDSAGNWRFTERGAGVKPIVCVGTAGQIVDHMMKYKNRIIRSDLESLPSKPCCALYKEHNCRYLRRSSGLQSWLAFRGHFPGSRLSPAILHTSHQYYGIC